MRRLSLTAVLAWPCVAGAHSFGQVLTLPMPIWLYLYGAASALLLSFAVLGLRRHSPPVVAAADTKPESPAVGRRRPWWEAAAVVLMLLAMASGIWGTPNPYRNFSMTWFWIVFLLGGLYASALIGKGIGWLNPWRTLLLFIDRRRLLVSSPAVNPAVLDPARVNPPDSNPTVVAPAWPALACYLALISFELFGHGSPQSLGIALLAYTLFTAAAGFAFGGAWWLSRGELFHSLFAVGGQLAFINRPAMKVSTPTLLFVVFLLSSTAFDGLKETVLWNRMFWQYIAPALTPWLGGNLAKAYPVLSDIKDAFELLVLVLSPLVYVGVIVIALKLARALKPPADRAAHSIREMLGALLPSLVPIAVAYNFAHYFSLLFGQGSRLFALLADPFGAGRGLVPRLPALDPLIAWHLQVGVILLGHVVGMAWCHRALWLPNRSRAVNLRVQLPLLVLMVLLTCSGLWLLSLPINSSHAL